MPFDVIFTDEAHDTFESIGDQILNRWGERELFNFGSRAYQLVEVVSKSPLAFQAINDNKQVRKAVIHKNCSVYYEVKEEKVIILFFWDNRQQPML